MTDRTLGIITAAVVLFVAFLFWTSIRDERAIDDGIAMQQGRHAFDKTK